MLKLRRKFSAVAAAVVLSMIFTLSAAASVSGGTYIPVTHTGQTVDSITFNSIKVNAVYSTSGGYGNSMYSCAALIMKFYKAVYGFNVWNLYSSYSTPTCSNFRKFILTSSPRIGDIVRFQDRTHWALVKAVNDDTVTIIEQNWGVYSSIGYSAPINRTVKIGDGQVSFFTYSGYNDKSTKKANEKVYDTWEEAVAVNTVNKKKISIESSDNLKLKNEKNIIESFFKFKIINS